MKTEYLDSVLKNCCHYDEIISFTPDEDDVITKNVIRYYQDYVFFNWNVSDKIAHLDLIINEYLKNRNFYNYVQKGFDEILNSLPLYDLLDNLYNAYQLEAIKKVDNTKWI